ncbi:MAG: hypothetical protein ABR552_01110 [Actinomycetota bacterium]
MRKLIPVAAALTIAASVILSGIARADRPDPHTQSLEDGCQRSQGMLLALSTPEWVYVDRADVLQKRLVGDQTAGRRSVEGVVTDSKPAGDDLFVNHEFVDMNVDVIPDPDYRFLIEQGNDNTVHTEWEDALVPMWAWPQVGDRVKESGNWIWDCGHWGDGPNDPTHVSPFLPYDPVETGQDLAHRETGEGSELNGEATELHPLYEMATTRKEAAGILGGTPSVLSQLDVWISGDGGGALAEEECAMKGVPPAAAQATCSRYRDVGGHYEYSLPLGTAPSGGSIVVEPVQVHGETDAALASIPVTIEQHPADSSITVSFDLPHAAAPQYFGITVQAGWSNQKANVKHVHVSVDNINVIHSLDGASEPSINPVLNGPEQTPGPGEWIMTAQANGHWVQISPSLVSQVDDGTQIPNSASFDYWLPAGIAPRLLVSARECDIPGIDCVHDVFGGHESPVPFHEVGYNDHPGRILATDAGNVGLHVGRLLTVGSQTLFPRYNSAHTADEDRSDYTCGDGFTGACYSVTATLTVS